MITYNRKKIQTPATADADELYAVGALPGFAVFSRALRTVQLAKVAAPAVVLTNSMLQTAASKYVALGTPPFDRMDPMAIR